MDEDTNISFKQFNFCPLCRLNHKKKKKHIYSKRHQEILKNILDKFWKKIADAKDTLEVPAIEAHGFEMGAKVWCYFCSEEVNKHNHLSSATVKHGGLLEHLVSCDHQKKTDTFFWDNIVSKHKKELYILSSEAFKSFQASSELAVRKYEEKISSKCKQDATKMRQREITKNIAIQSASRKSQIRQQFITSPVEGSTVSETTVTKRTLSAHGPGLTCIDIQAYVSKGNIFTGDAPPWLRRADQTTAGSSTRDIGPSVDEYRKHLEREKKRKLPPNRVGAKYDHSTATTSQWLPDFGRVWNHGRRSTSKQFFEKQLKRNKDRFINTEAISERITDVVIPYKRKRPVESTITSLSVGETSGISEHLTGSRFEEKHSIPSHNEHLIHQSSMMPRNLSSFSQTVSSNLQNVTSMVPINRFNHWNPLTPVANYNQSCSSLPNTSPTSISGFNQSYPLPVDNSAPNIKQQYISHNPG